MRMRSVRTPSSMSPGTTPAIEAPAQRSKATRRTRGRRQRIFALFAAMSVVAGCSSADATTETNSEAHQATTTSTVETTTTSQPTTTTNGHDHSDDDDSVDPMEIAEANRAAAGYQDVAVAEDGGYASTIDTLGCFEDPDQGGMGLHWLKESLMDDQVHVTQPEALVYELDADGEVTGLVAHEYIVPIEAWTSTEPPNLFGLDFHQHSSLPLWILHAWIWKDNPRGMFVDYNPKVRLCPEGVPIFGIDLP